MSDPAYHLRINKAVDRFALIEAIRFLPKLNVKLEDYTYYGLGGPYLEDMRIIYQNFPEIPLVSIEGKIRVFNRQKFHMPCATLKLIKSNSKDFISNFQANNKKGIFWLDYTELSYPCFQDFFILLQNVVQGSMIKITLKSQSRDYFGETPEITEQKHKAFKEEFSAILPHPDSVPKRKLEEFAYLIQQMAQRVAQQSLSATVTPFTFYPISSFCYSDGTGIFTLTGIKWPRDDRISIENAFRDWEFKNLDWREPTRINIPNLSTKERLRLQEFLPCPSGTARGRILRRELGYQIEDTNELTVTALEQYAKFHRYFPYLLRGIP